MLLDVTVDPCRQRIEIEMPVVSEHAVGIDISARMPSDHGVGPPEVARRQRALSRFEKVDRRVVDRAGSTGSGSRHRLGC